MLFELKYCEKRSKIKILQICDFFKKDGCDYLRKPKIVILGAGYAGITTTVRLQKKLHPKDAEIILVNKHDYHYQTTWLHKNAVGKLNNEQTKFSLHQLIDQKKVQFIKDTVQSIDVKGKKVYGKDQTFTYDYLVVALGSEVDTYQIPGLKEHAFSINTLASATRLSAHLEAEFHQFSQTNQETFPIVVGGGGFTGVELLGELTERLSSLCEKYQIDPKKIKLQCVESESTVLPEFDLELGEYAMQKLEERGVEFRLGITIKSVAADQIKIEQAGLIEDIPARIFVWTAGVRGNRIIEESDLPTYESKVEVDTHLTAPGYPNVFVIGDVASVRDSEGKPYLPNANIAMQKAIICARNIVALLKGKQEMQDFTFRNFGTIASLGKRDAIGVVFRNKKIFGWTASCLKTLVNYFVLYEIGGLKLLFTKR